MRSVGVAYILWFFFGLLGVHKFYIGKPLMGVLYLFTGGIFFIGWLIDLFTIPGQIQRANERAVHGLAEAAGGREGPV